MLSFKQLKQKLMNDLKQRVIKNYAYDKRADDICYHLNFGEKNRTTKKSRDEVLIEMMVQIKDDILSQMNDGFKAVNERMDKLENRMDKLENRIDKLENKVDEGFEKINARLDQLENQAIAHGWNIKKI